MSFCERMCALSSAMDTLTSKRVDCLRYIATAAASTGKVGYGSFVAGGVHRDVSVALVPGDHGIIRKAFSCTIGPQGILRCMDISCPQLNSNRFLHDCYYVLVPTQLLSIRNFPQAADFACTCSTPKHLCILMHYHAHKNCS
jgi:hypothetical protein